MATAEGADWGIFTAILAMAVATYLMRAGGFFIMAKVPLTPTLRRMLEALPGAVVTATILPIIAREGLAAMLAIAAAGVVARIAAQFIAGWGFIVIGAVAGSIAGGFIGDE